MYEHIMKFPQVGSYDVHIYVYAYRNSVDDSVRGMHTNFITKNCGGDYLVHITRILQIALDDLSDVGNIIYLNIYTMIQITYKQD